MDYAIGEEVWYRHLYSDVWYKAVVKNFHSYGIHVECGGSQVICTSSQLKKKRGRSVS